MSVINKMLRDLDHRQAEAAPPSALRQGTSSIAVDTSSQPGQRQRLLLWLGLPAGLAALAAVIWVWTQAHPDSPLAPTVVVAPGASPVAPAAAAPEVAQPAPATAPVPAGPAAITSGPADSPAPAQPPAPTVLASNAPPGAMVLRMEESLSTRRALDALLATPASPPPAAPPITAERGKPRPAQPAPAPVAAVTASVPGTKTAAPTDAAPLVQRQQQAGGDALAQAQNLWNSGSRDAAMDLMQQSIAAAERTAKSGGGGAASNPVLVPLVREMARMQLAEGRFGAVWEMLTRLEPLLGNQADLWAIRANAAQRLGRHQDSVHAYMVALQSRPDEQRWLLGTAVSLAALGQTSSAADMLDKARAVGPVSKDILAYLRQAGVPFRD